MFVLTELGGRTPGQPGIEVTGIVSTSKTKTKNGVVDVEEKQTIAIKHKGKVEAMKSNPSKFIVFTADPVNEEVAKKEYGAATREYSVSSSASFKYKDKENNEHVTRVRGKIQVPYFTRKEAFSCFGPIASSNRVEALGEADKKQVVMLYSAACHSPQLQDEVCTALGLNALLEDMEKANATPKLDEASFA